MMRRSTGIPFPYKLSKAYYSSDASSATAERPESLVGPSRLGVISGLRVRVGGASSL